MCGLVTCERLSQNGEIEYVQKTLEIYSEKIKEYLENQKVKIIY